MNNISSIPIGDFKNALSFPSEETSLGSGLPSHPRWGMYHARPALLTVFSITQLKYSITQQIPCHHGFGKAYIIVCLSKIEMTGRAGWKKDSSVFDSLNSLTRGKDSVLALRKKSGLSTCPQRNIIEQGDIKKLYGIGGGLASFDDTGRIHEDI